MLLPTVSRFTVFQSCTQKLWDLYKKAQMNWTAEEIDLGTDMDDWERLTDNERHFITYILAFFAGSDGIVNENIDLNFASEVQWPEARCFYSYQEHNECVHEETYSLLIDKFIKDDAEKNQLFNDRYYPLHQRQSAMGFELFRQGRSFGERYGVRVRRRYLLLRCVLCHFLAQETWIDERSLILERAHLA